jgi:hypothetical protein
VFTSQSFNSGNLGHRRHLPPDGGQHRRRQLRQLQRRPHVPASTTR